MGSAASSQSLTKDQKAFITQKLKKLYDEGAATEDPVALNNTLSAEYARLADTFVRLNAEMKESVATPRGGGGNTPSTPRAVVSVTRASFGDKEKSTSTKGRSDLSGGKAGPKARAGRRRSFDLSATKKAVGASEPNQIELALAISRSAAEMPTLQEVADSWDSVTTQPFCDTCKMAFKSLAFLERHVKFSSIHADNVKKIKPEGLAALTSPPKPSKKEILVAQQEGTHFRLLYSGNKFYWRLQESLDFDIYHHFLAHCIEIIPYNCQKQKEMSRLYLDYEAMLLALEGPVAEEVEQRINDLKKDRFAEVPEKEGKLALKEEILTKKIVTYMLQRLRFEGGVCDFAPSSADDPDHFPVMEKRPVVLVPVVVTRRRRSSAEEINDTMLSIRDDRNAINASLEKAKMFSTDSKTVVAQKMDYSNRIANLVYSAACYFSAKPIYVMKSLPLRRFHRAADMIIRRNMVAKTRIYLDKKGLNVPKGPPRKRSVLTVSPMKPK